MANADSYILLVDDIDIDRILYTNSSTGQWSASKSNFAHNFTIHELGTGQANFSFAFNGTSLSLLGIVLANATPASVNCTVDGDITGQPGQLPSLPQKEVAAADHLEYCNFPTLSNDMEHNLTVVVDASAGNFNLDSITYTVPKNSPQNFVPPGSAARVVVDDSQMNMIQYDGPRGASSWSAQGLEGDFNTTLHAASCSGAKATFEFSGTEIQVYGTVKNDANATITSTYTFDAQIPIPYNLSEFASGIGGGDTPARQIQFFDSQSYPDGHHTLIIQSDATGGSFFSLDFIVYTASPDFGFFASDRNGESGRDHSGTSMHGSMAIVGAAVAIAVATLLVILAFLIMYHRRKQARLREDYESAIRQIPAPYPREFVISRRTALPCTESSYSGYGFGDGKRTLYQWVTEHRRPPSFSSSESTVTMEDASREYARSHSIVRE